MLLAAALLPISAASNDSLLSAIASKQHQQLQPQLSHLAANLTALTLFDQDAAFPILFAVVAAVLAMAVIFGNLLIAMPVLTIRHFRRQTGNWLLVSVAFADLLVGCFVVPLACYYEMVGRQWTLGSALCILWTSSDVLLCTASILSLSMVSLDRYWMISDPLSYASQRTSRRMLFYIAIVWLISASVSLVPIIAFPNALLQSIDADKTCQVTPNPIYQIYAVITSFYLPVLIILTVNCKIFGAVRRIAVKDRKMSMKTKIKRKVSSHIRPSVSSADYEYHEQPAIKLNSRYLQTSHLKKKSLSCTQLNSEPNEPKSPTLKAPKAEHQMSTNSLRSQQSPDSNLNLNTDGPLRRTSSWRASLKRRKMRALNKLEETKAATTLVIITGTFIVCWLPFFAIALIKALCSDQMCPMPPGLELTALWLGYLNSAVNPLLITRYNHDYKVLLHQVLRCRCSRIEHAFKAKRFSEVYGDAHSIRERTSKSSVKENDCNKNYDSDNSECVRSPSADFDPAQNFPMSPFVVEDNHVDKLPAATPSSTPNCAIPKNIIIITINDSSIDQLNYL